MPLLLRLITMMMTDRVKITYRPEYAAHRSSADRPITTV